MRTESIAGSDTTAGAIRGTLLHIMTNPCTKNLPYLQAVIREGMRVWPPVANIFSRDVPAGGDTLVVDDESVFLPGGTCIGYSAYAMHQNEEIYGTDAEAFQPERWFESDQAKLADMILTNDLMFGYGKLQSLGKPVAQIEIGKTIFELLRNFDLALIRPTRPWDVRNLVGLFAISSM
ncbi:hypothetical protein N7536_004055 [Penicillium majusculum]|uniref:Uncharacterized protein n=1 Tax=Penicillium solitum TaxID=60172 RepID=A0A1V6QDR8_9EURO|nr:uncharacterized protein PENSOL_c080G00348 [Penicillium solitum]KAJ5693643.1 hypothetical protein N7536_004055 [Penicillium majusculum]OQD87351.1 hypothetical protein PENSOL_c080G00348 [Penicillium solitum]